MEYVLNVEAFGILFYVFINLRFFWTQWNKFKDRNFDHENSESGETSTEYDIDLDVSNEDELSKPLIDDERKN